MRLVPHAMSRRLVIVPLLFLLAGAASASPLTADMKRVEVIRGLTFLHDVRNETIERSTLREHLRAEMSKGMPYSTDDYVLVLRALQLVDKKSDKDDVFGRMLALYESQVLAYYDPLTHVYYSISGLPSAISLAGNANQMHDFVESIRLHELTHALQDQRFHVGDRDRTLVHDTDGGLAYHALLEGEATVVMMAYMLEKSGMSLTDAVKNDTLLDSLAGAANAPDSVDPSTPRYFVESMKFPYIDGMRLVLLAYKRGGWKEVDRLHADPPRTTSEVLHPETYFARIDGGGAARAAFDPKPFDGVANPLTVEHLGEFHWRYLVGEKSSAGWVDDRVTVAQDAFCQPTVLAETRWSDAAHAEAFRDAYLGFLRGRGIDPRFATDGNTVRVAYGADDVLMQRFIP